MYALSSSMHRTMLESPICGYAIRGVINDSGLPYLFHFPFEVPWGINTRRRKAYIWMPSSAAKAPRNIVCCDTLVQVPMVKCVPRIYGLAEWINRVACSEMARQDCGNSCRRLWQAFALAISLDSRYIPCRSKITVCDTKFGNSTAGEETLSVYLIGIN